LIKGLNSQNFETK